MDDNIDLTGDYDKDCASLLSEIERLKSGLKKLITTSIPRSIHSNPIKKLAFSDENLIKQIERIINE